MPSSPNYVRDYKQEGATARKRGDTKARAKRNAARAKLKKAGVKVAGKDVDHKKGVAAGNGSKNLRVQSVKTNRSAGGKKGSTAGKAAGARKANIKKKRKPTPKITLPKPPRPKPKRIK